MVGDQRRDHPKSEVGSRSPFPRSEATSSERRDGALEGAFEAPTRPRGRTIADSEAPAEPRAGLSAPALRATQDSFHPVRVPARSARPPLSLWTHAWATVALVIVVTGGAIGIVASLRARTLGPGERGREQDRSRVAAAAAAQNGSAGVVETKGVATRAALPAAAPGITALAPLAPAPAASRNAAAKSAVEPPPLASSPSVLSARASPSAVAFRTPESLSVSPNLAPPASALTLSRRPKPTEPTPPPLAITLPPDESAHAPTPAPATSDTPQPKGESEAWVTEERRF